MPKEQRSKRERQESSKRKQKKRVLDASHFGAEEKLVPKIAPPQKPRPATAEELAALERQFAK